MSSADRPGGPKPIKTLDEVFEALLRGDEPPPPLPDLRLTPEQVKAWQAAHDAALCKIGEGTFDAVEMVGEQRR